MDKENPTTETENKPKGNETPEVIESPEELRQEMTEQSKEEVESFKKESQEELARFEGGNEEDKEALQGLNNEATKAKSDLLAEISDENKEWTPESDFPPPIPEQGKQSEKTKVCAKCGAEIASSAKFCTECGSGMVPPPIPKIADQNEKTEKEPEYGSVKYYLQQSKITDKNEALQSLMVYCGVNSEEALRNKLKEKDGNGDNVIEINLLTPDNIKYLEDPSEQILRKIKDTGDALGYTFMNTPEYESQVDDLKDKLIRNGEKEKALQAEKIFEELRKNFENEKEKSEFQRIDENLTSLFKNEEKFKKYVEEQKNLPPNAIIHLYHGLGSAGYKGALDVLNSPSHGIEQHSGPTVSLAPVGHFWKGVGFRYALRRDQIEFPGENNPNAVVRMQKNDFGDEGDGIIIHDSKSLPLDQFEAEVMRSKFVYPSPELEKELVEKLRHFSEARNAREKRTNE